MNVRAYVAGFVLVLTTVGVGAQSVPEVKLSPSPRGSAEVQVGGSWTTVDGNRSYTGGKWLTVDYGRPILRGRQSIFGSGASYGKDVNAGAPLWRAGANGTTRLTTQAVLEMGGKTLQPGVYNVLVELKDKAWTLVVSTQEVQPGFDENDKTRLSGATNYDPKFDVVRVPMRVTTTSVSVEQFTIGFVNMAEGRGSLAMWWDTTMAVADFTIK